MIEPVHFQGLNCYHDCVCSVANGFGIYYPDAFASLWSETDFRYDPHREDYLTKRLISSLEKLGAKIENLPVLSLEQKDESLSLLKDGDCIIVGMDAFYIPWSSFYQIFHGYHYFIAQYERRTILSCADPTYGRQSESIPRDTVVTHVLDLIRVSRCEASPLRHDTADEAREILRTHEQQREALLARVRSCTGAEPGSVLLTAKYINAMMNNRYMYRYFLERRAASYSGLFCDGLFSKWKAVKNGLYKAAVSKNNASVTGAVCDCLNAVIDEELSAAKSIVCG